MSYDVPTVGDFIDRFPEFTDVSEYRITAVIGEAQAYVDTSWREADFSNALLFLTAHMLSMEGVLDTEIISGVPLDSVSQFKLGDASISFKGESSGSSGSSASEFGDTSYGRKYLSLLRKNKGGPRVINQ